MIDLLFLHYGDPWVRGSENCLLALAAGLDPRRYRIHALCNQSVMVEALRQRGVSAEELALPEIMIDGAERRLQWRGYLNTTRRLRQVIRARRPALLYCNSGRASQAAWLAGRLSGVPRLCHLHAPFYRRYYWLWGLWDVAGLIFPSRATQETSLRRHRPQAPVYTVPNGVDLSRFRPVHRRNPGVRQRLGLDPDEVVVGQVGSLIERKGVDVLLRAWARVRPSGARLVLAGGGPDRSKLELLARRLGVEDSVRFLGEVQGTETLLQQVVDIHVLAAREESMPLALLEAAACGVPSIASDVGGASEIVVPDQTGILVPAGEPGALGEAIRQLVCDAPLRMALGQSARKAAEESFGIERFVEGVERAIRETLNRTSVQVGPDESDASGHDGASTR